MRKGVERWNSGQRTTITIAAGASALLPLRWVMTVMALADYASADDELVSLDIFC